MNNLTIVFLVTLTCGLIMSGVFAYVLHRYRVELHKYYEELKK